MPYPPQGLNPAYATEVSAPDPVLDAFADADPMTAPARGMLPDAFENELAFEPRSSGGGATLTPAYGTDAAPAPRFAPPAVQFRSSAGAAGATPAYASEVAPVPHGTYPPSAAAAAAAAAAPKRPKASRMPEAMVARLATPEELAAEEAEAERKGRLLLTQVRRDGLGRERLHRPLQGEQYYKESRDDGGTVKYYTQEKRKRYQVDVGAAMRWASNGLEIDTEQLLAVVRDRFGPGKVNGHLMGSTTGPAARLPEGYANRAVLWVCAPGPNGDATFYTNPCRPGRIHHSSFSVEKEVIAAGEWVIDHGKLKMISANSGHFRTDQATFYNAVLHLASAFHADTTVVQWDTRDRRYVARPIREFISRPSDNKRYTMHVAYG